MLLKSCAISPTTMPRLSSACASWELPLVPMAPPAVPVALVELVESSFSRFVDSWDISQSSVLVRYVVLVLRYCKAGAHATRWQAGAVKLILPLLHPVSRA